MLNQELLHKIADTICKDHSRIAYCPEKGPRNRLLRGTYIGEISFSSSFGEVKLANLPVPVFDPNIKHTMQASAYAKAHLPAPLLDEVVNDSWSAEVYCCTLNATMARLQREGFTVLRMFETKAGNFNKFIATNPTFGESKLVLQTVPGARSYATDILGILQLYKTPEGKSISSSNIKYYVQNTDLREKYNNLMKENGIAPDILFMGQAQSLGKYLIEQFEKHGQKIEPEKYKGEGYNFLVYRYLKDGKPITILSVEIIPDFFGAAAGVLTKAAIDNGARKVVFIGTAGGIDPSQRVGDFLSPKLYALGGINIPDSDNDLEIELAESGSARRTKSGVVIKHMTVDTPLQEYDHIYREWLRSGVVSVDCEIGHVARAVVKSNRAVEFVPLLMITDVLGTTESYDTFFENEHPATPAQAKSNGRINENLQVILGKDLCAESLVVIPRKRVPGLKLEYKFDTLNQDSEIESAVICVELPEHPLSMSTSRLVNHFIEAEIEKRKLEGVIFATDLSGIFDNIRIFKTKIKELTGINIKIDLSISDGKQDKP